MVRRLFLSAVAAEANRRLQQRFPFFMPARMRLGAANGQQLSGWSTDISAEGIGLLHRMPLERRRITLAVPNAEGQQIDISTEINWCQPVCNEWFVQTWLHRG